MLADDIYSVHFETLAGEGDGVVVVTGEKSNPRLICLRAIGTGDQPIAALKGKRKGPVTPQEGDRATTIRNLFFAYFSVQTLMLFMPVSASVLVLNVSLSTTVVVVAVGFLSTTVHFLVEASRTT
jgi:hypothetical protein